MKKLIPSHVVFNGKVGALTGKNALTAKVGENVLIVHSQANRDSRPHLIGGHGDYVWEWTSTCFVRSRVDETGNAGRPTVNCGVRVAEGAHRAYVTDFIRDARAGGCAQGVPPANLGFRLVREEPSWVASVSARLGLSPTAPDRPRGMGLAFARTTPRMWWAPRSRKRHHL